MTLDGLIECLQNLNVSGRTRVYIETEVAPEVAYQLEVGSVAVEEGSYDTVILLAGLK